MGRHPTIWDGRIGILRRIPARSLPWGPRALNPNLFSIYLDPEDAKMQTFARFSNFFSTHCAGFGSLWGPHGKDPKGPHFPFVEDFPIPPFVAKGSQSQCLTQV